MVPFFTATDSTDGRPSAPTAALRVPRVALYKSWTASADEGWTRWLLDQFEFPFTNIFDADVRAGSLHERFDVVIIPSLSTNAIVEGHRRGTIPPQYVGGITQGGVRDIKSFVEEGGTLVTLNSGCLFAIDELDLPVSDALEDLRAPGRGEGEDDDGATAPEFACPGSMLRMEFDTSHPVAYGMPEEAPAFFNRSPAFTINASFDEEEAPTAIARYLGDSLLMSGYLLGERHLTGKVSAVEVPLGEGKVILLGFGVQNRAQPHGSIIFLRLVQSA